ncbi:class I SAM-dependent methyltransferase [Mesorhizobium australicum]|uniref:Methyltransferase domain-containing protein n=1 Tax=Mesorhizobium australicum TaxID=536018 RepID=A0A1X7PC87_9HYPH|nr:class I SAM-dependent methyltransferase [Mesorhizobium australicum]SMH47943.1 hypothetical protein SAMN02982922_3621 [Mesorhizobium australicum]
MAGYEQVTDHKGAPYHAVLRSLHATLNPRTYLEIGTLNGATLKLSTAKSIAIDPKFQVDGNCLVGKPACHFFQMTSDQFFRDHSPSALLGSEIDLAFLDGMHLFEYLLRDFINTERHCRPNSIIAMHDCIPTDSHVARRSGGDQRYSETSPHPEWWAGDVWKVLLALREFRPELTIVSVDAPPTGLVLVSNLSPTSTVLSDSYFEIVRKYIDMEISDIGLEKYFAEINMTPTAKLSDLSGISKYFWL